MGKCKGCGKLGRIMSQHGDLSGYNHDLMLPPIVSVWECVIRKRKYSYRPEWNKVQPSVKKVKKKQGKDELDRIKQAEKKKRRLEKALATSAAIRTELEMKKLKKKEEQQRLDEEGAAIAEAVALHVLIGEDSDDLCNLTLNSSSAFGPWICDRHFGCPAAVRRASIMTEDCRRHSLEGMGWTSSTQGVGFEKGDWAFYPKDYGTGIHGQLTANRHRGWAATELSPGLIAAQAVASLQIRDNGHVDRVSY